MAKATRTGPSNEGGDAPPVRAVIYARMSTEHQQYSTQNQSDVIREYAARRNMEIIRSYTDEGKSGLRLDGRDALKRLIADVQSGRADFEVILVYDVSRWGRFQDADEPAYYEHLCRRAGIIVLYCAEQFENDGGPLSNLIKSVKRTMAGEYSRELSTKVFRGQCRLIQLGFRQGGTAGYGIRRMLVDHAGKRKGALGQGEHKSIQTDRVILVPGPREETKTVEWIFHQFVEEGQAESDIAAALNEQGVKTDLGHPWTRATVKQVLTNEKYIGNNVYNRISFKLKAKRVRNAAEEWVRADGAFKAIVDPEIFWSAREIMLTRAHRYSDAELLDGLRQLYEKRGWLSSIIINECETVPSSCVYSHRFGGLLRAYQLVGYAPDRDYEYLEVNRRLRTMHPETVQGVVDAMELLGGSMSRDPETDLIRVNDEFDVSIVIARCQQTPAGSLRWNIRLDRTLEPDITVAVRLDASNENPLDYYLLPSLDMNVAKLRLAESNGLYLDVYRFETLDYLFGMARRTQIEVA